MRTTGRIRGLYLDCKTKKLLISLEADTGADEAEKLMGIALDIRLEKAGKHRSIDANAMLWACLSRTATATGMTNWEAYLHALERYGKFTHILVRREALEDIKRLWRETKEVGERDGMVELLCFFGSSTYSAKEFSRLLEGVMGDMEDLGLERPPSSEMKRALEAYEKREQRKQGAGN